MLQTIRWDGRAVQLIDQTRLPTETVYAPITDEKQMWDAIKRLVVRGAPAIGVAAAFGVYLGVRDADDRAYPKRLDEVCAYLKTSRPTAVNLFWAIDRVKQVAQRSRAALLDECLKMLDEDIAACRAIGDHGEKLLGELRCDKQHLGILTHCNAGGLCAVQYGTALAPIYVGAERGRKFHVYADETRPLLQGSRITAYELRQNKIPVTVICDNMAATVMRDGKIDACIVGADRIAANGDTANKIGTLGVAILAKHYKIPFLVAAPLSTIDRALASGTQIPIEERDPREISNGMGKQTAPSGVEIYNPAFDVTPAELVTAIITEKGAIRAPFEASIKALFAS
jgi:methylthioribose-1-phosphate isomerase